MKTLKANERTHANHRWSCDEIRPLALKRGSTFDRRVAQYSSTAFGHVMKTFQFIFSILAAAMAAGCAIGPNYSRVVIETGQPNFGDVDDARAMAQRLSRHRGGDVTTLDHARRGAPPAAATVGP